MMAELFFQWIFFAMMLMPHGDLDLRIKEVTQQIESNPDNADLYLLRGILYNQHEEYDKAKADFLLCITLGLSDDRVYTGISDSYLRLMNSDSAIYYIDLVLKNDPDNLSALESKANILLVEERFCEAAELFHKTVIEAESPAPFLFLQATNAYSGCNEPESPGNSIQVLKEGLNKIPGNEVLQKELVQLYSLQKNYDDAILLQTEIINQSSFKARSYYQRAQLYVQTNQTELALSDLTTALYHLTEIPQHKKEVDSIVLLRQQIEHLLITLKE